MNVLAASAEAFDRGPARSFGVWLSRVWISLIAGLSLLAASYFIVARSCGFDHLSVLVYGLYIGLYVGLPGWAVLDIAQRRTPSVLEALSIGLPLGFAIEIGLFFLASAFHLKAFLIFSPVLWLALYYWRGVRAGSVFRFKVAGWGTSTSRAAVAVLIFAFTATIASQFYACAPFTQGMLESPTHLDWIYLLSRAAEIKQRWPLQDPSLAGTPLSYHYFLLVHLASAATVTGIKLELIGLRLFVLPLSAALMAQGLYLGKTLTRSIWGGILATALLLIANELSFRDPSSESSFGNDFVRWLFVSPTFFFGMIFSGALIIWIHRLLANSRLSGVEGLILFLLSAAATGAKGTVVPPLLLALIIWWMIEGVRDRKIAPKTTFLLIATGAGFGLVYFGILSAWGTGAAVIAPFFSIKLSYFWREYAELWSGILRGLGIPLGGALFLGQLTCGIAVLIGFSGVRLLGLITVWRWKRQSDQALACWLGLVWSMYFAFGHFLVLDSNSQFYLLFPLRLPEAILAAAAIHGSFFATKSRLAEFSGMAPLYTRQLILLCALVLGGMFIFIGTISWWMGIVLFCVAAFYLAPSKEHKTVISVAAFGRFAWKTSPFVAIAVLALVQVNHWRLSSRQGFKLWLTQSNVPADQGIVSLREATDWIRENTPSDAVFVANTFSEKHLRAGAIAEVDKTTVDKYYYYSAFAERRFWVEGCTYLLNQYAAARRVSTASQVFAGGSVSLLFSEEKGHPDYILLDRSLEDGAIVRLPADRCVFENTRIAVYRLDPPSRGSVDRVATLP